MSKNIVVFFSDPETMGYPLNKEEYFQSYKELNAVIAELGGVFYIARSQNSYQGNGFFSNSWKINESGLIEESGPITADVIYDKGYFVSDNTTPVLNNDAINRVCTDKWETYQAFRSFCPKTILVESAGELRSAIEEMKTELKVIKPLDGEEGHGVHIGKDQELFNETIKYPVLVQEFLDSSAGIQPFTEGIHDFRIALLNGQIIYAFLRTPPSGELKANVALGGKLLVIEESDIPKPFVDLAMKIDQLMSTYGSRLYGVDMAMTESGPKIIELNSRLGLQGNARHKVFIHFKEQLAKLLMAMN